MDAGIYTVVLTNKITKEEQRRSLQLLVNGKFSTLFPKLKEKEVFLTSLSVLQYLLILSRRRWLRTQMFTPTAAAPR